MAQRLMRGMPTDRACLLVRRQPGVGKVTGQNAPFRHVAAPGRCGATARQAAGHYGKWLNWANALGKPPARLRGGLRQGPQISVWSLSSRKDALCPTCGLQTAPFREGVYTECAFP